MSEGVTQDQVNKAVLEAARWFYETNSREGDCRIKFFEKLKEWQEFNLLFQTPWTNFMVGYAVAKLGLDRMLNMPEVNEAFAYAVAQELDSGE